MMAKIDKTRKFTGGDASMAAMYPLKQTGRVSSIHGISK
jgi:hypothetical protein